MTETTANQTEWVVREFELDRKFLIDLLDEYCKQQENFCSFCRKNDCCFC